MAYSRETTLQPALPPIATDIASFGAPAPVTMQPLSPALPTVPMPATLSTMAPAAPGAPLAPAAEGPTGWQGWKQGFGGALVKQDGSLDLENIGGLAKTLGGLGTLWAGFQANSIAKDTLGFQKDSYKTNLANQLQSYNTAIEDRAGARAAAAGLTGAERDATVAAYVNKHRARG
jgi:hypothetical protein